MNCIILNVKDTLRRLAIFLEVDPTLWPDSRRGGPRNSAKSSHRIDCITFDKLRHQFDIDNKGLADFINKNDSFSGPRPTSEPKFSELLTALKCDTRTGYMFKKAVYNINKQ